MDTLASGIILSVILLACAVLLRNLPTQPGETPRRNKQVLIGVLVGASILAFVATIVAPLVHALPQSVVAFVERVMPKQLSLGHPFRFKPAAEQVFIDFWRHV
jgi:hypothetical protein